MIGKFNTIENKDCKPPFGRIGNQKKSTKKLLTPSKVTFKTATDCFLFRLFQSDFFGEPCK